MEKAKKVLGKITVITLILGVIFDILPGSDYSFDTWDEVKLVFTLLFIMVHWATLILWALVAYLAKPSVSEKMEERRANAYEENQKIIAAEYEQAVASQNLSAPWAVRYSTSSCPYCGHYKVRNATWDDKKISVAFWGAASSKIGKNYICDNCKNVW